MEGLVHEAQPRTRLNYFAIFLSIVAIATAGIALFAGQRRSSTEPIRLSVLETMKRTKTIRAGYSGFRPYTIINLATQDSDKRITGFCPDMLREIASRQNPPWQIEWHQVTFETLRTDMESGRFDVFADAVYETIPRATDFAFTIPYSYFGVAAGLVRCGDDRFKQFSDLDRPDITIALAEGWTSTEFARQRLSKPKFKLLAVAEDPFVQLQEVIAGRADVALQDVPTILQFARAHPDEVKALWVENPPTMVPGAFMIRQGESDLLEFLNTSIRVLQADGTIARLDKKWMALSEFPELPLRPGAGLTPH